MGYRADFEVSDAIRQARQVADLLDRIAAALDILRDDRFPSIGQLDEIIAKLERIIALRKEAAE